ncbi:MAG: UDP-3-O-(3-hydroxymyristoyl) glucosamine N-acyltransferase [Bacteroidetes bacterium]|nr:UDP-3-O-(3-hydroxymyristoyl) glucosamine N-acyltransferase [Bacteroidota bacterium]
MQFTAKDIAALLGGTLEGNPDQVVTGIAKIEEANSYSLSFIANPKYEQYAQTAEAGILLINQVLPVSNEKIGAMIRVADPYAAFTTLLELYQKLISQKQEKGIQQPSHIGNGSTHGSDLFLGAFAYIGENVTIGRNVKIYPGSYIGDEVSIGDDTLIHAGAKIYEGCKIGKGCVIHAGVVIGGDGFGFAPLADGSYKKVPQLGIVEIGNDVEIGANTVIDRATIGATIVKNGVKLDNLIHIAHNVEIGENTVIAAQTGISGSTRIGRQAMIGGQVGIIGHIRIADGVRINAQSGVSKSIEVKNKAVTGSPAAEFRDHYKGLAYIKLIPELMKRIDELEKQLNKDPHI